MGLFSIGQFSLHVAIPVPAPLSPRCSGATQLWSHPEPAPLCISSEPLCPRSWPGPPRRGAGRGRCQSWLCLPCSPIHAATAAFVPDVAGTAGAAQHGNYSLPRPVPSRDGCFPHDRMLSKAPHPGLSRVQSAQPKKGAGKSVWRTGEGSSGAVPTSAVQLENARGGLRKTPSATRPL